MKTEEYSSERREIAGIGVTVTRYRIGETYHCHVENLDPGATISRSSAATAEQAEENAVSKAEQRLARK